MCLGKAGWQTSDISRLRDGECLAETSSADRPSRSSRLGAARSHILQVSLILFALCSSSLAQNQYASASTFGQDCSFSTFMTRTATAVTGPRSLRLDDGTEVVVAGVLPPSKLDHPSVPEIWPLPGHSAKALSDATIGRTIELSGNESMRDRYGRRVAQIRILSGQHRLWLQAYLVRTGAARVLIRNINDVCKAGALLRHEQKARGRSAGLWADAGYAIRKASKPWELLRYRSTLQIVEGRVRNVSRVRSRIFINFGKNWRRDFTIGVRQKVAKKLRVSGLTLEKLKGRKIRVRGWIQRRGGPYVQLHKATQISLVPDKKIAGKLPKNQSRNPFPAHQPKQKRPTFAKPGAIDL